MSFYDRRETHELFENRVYAELERDGFVVRDLTYHTHLDEETVTLLSTIRTPTALLIRTRADRFILHRSLPLVVEIELKTSGSADGSFAIEAFPLAMHAIEARNMNAMCLYICQQTHTGREFGFWVPDIVPHIRNIYIPPAWYKFTQENKQWLLNAFPGVKLSYQETDTRGSNTPYVRIPEFITKNFPHWKEHIRKLLPEEEVSEQATLF